MSANSPSEKPTRPVSDQDRQEARSKLVWWIWAAAVAFIFFAMWVKNRGASVSKPQAVEQHTDSNVPANPEPSTPKHYLNQLTVQSTNSFSAQLISQLLNPSLPVKTRRQAARALAKLGTDESVAALKSALRDGPPYLKAAIAEGLGESSNREARGMLIDLINGPDETTARGAIRGLALRGDAEAADILGNVLFNAQKPESVRTEAALSLGEVEQPGALTALMRAAGEIQDQAISEQVLEGLAKRPFAETSEFFHNFLASPDVRSETKVSALEALGNSTGDIAALVLPYASDSDPEIRAAAAWALSATETHADLGPRLVDLLQQETSPEVRARLFEALGGQDHYDTAAVLAQVQKEPDLAARQAGLGLLAETCRSAPTPEVLAYFNQTAVPELENTALTSTDQQNRLSSVMTLRRAGTPESTTALEDIVRQSSDQRIVDAARGGRRVNSKP